MTNQLTPIECFFYGMQFARIISDEYYRRHGHIKIVDRVVHHYLLLLLVPFIDDECFQAFIAGAGLDDLPDLLDNLFKESTTVRNFTDSIRESRGDLRKHREEFNE